MSEDFRDVFAKNINKYLKIKGRKQIDLAKHLDINRATVNAWCHGTRYPRPEAIEKIAAFLDVSPSDLVTDPDEVIPDNINIGVRVPVLGDVVGGEPIDEIEDIEGYAYVSPEMAYGSDLFALRIKGQSMEPEIKDGDAVIVRQQPMVENGQIAIVSVEGNRGTCKIFEKDKEGISLIPINPNYKEISIPRDEANEVRILGKVIQVIRNI